VNQERNLDIGRQAGGLFSVIGVMQRALNWVSAKLMLISVGALIVMLFLTVIDILGSKLFNSPIKGSLDFISLLLVIAGAFGIANTEVMEKHIRVDFLTVKFSEKGRLILKMYNAFLGIFIFVIAFAACFNQTLKLFHSGEGTLTMQIVWWPFMGVLAFNLLFLLLVIIFQVFDAWKGLAKR
jgi:TRAP-type C4-dicarboxylate transport system permease small subunit